METINTPIWHLYDFAYDRKEAEEARYAEIERMAKDKAPEIKANLTADQRRDIMQFIYCDSDKAERIEELIIQCRTVGSYSHLNAWLDKQEDEWCLLEATADAQTEIAALEDSE